MQLRRFPFDRQQSEAIFEVLGLGQDRGVLVADPRTTGGKDQGVDIAQWDLLEVGALESVGSRHREIYHPA
jgi:hypothetical protein